ncbi:hypothetical protein Lalb_Chr25g0280971 [Lupinus albus]|uniref:Uncharacterized protein n=1 Tax=Lupinus albus TaxID=3870 RepID=A0A6A4MKA4_LUPAL|nr:hypothetical protein Lalb_Chr25g0280971 [Lupinus albus]
MILHSEEKTKYLAIKKIKLTEIHLFGKIILVILNHLKIIALGRSDIFNIKKDT